MTTSAATALATIEQPNIPTLADPEEILAVLKLYHQETGMSLPAMAKASSLHFNSLNRLYDPKWRPRLDTLRHLHSWLTGIGRINPPLSELPLYGDHWSLTLEDDGWHVIADRSRRLGPFTAMREAVAVALRSFPDDKPGK